MTPDSVNVSVAAAPALSLSAVVVGAGLQVSGSGGLGATNYGTTTVRVTSSNPAVALVARTASRRTAP